MICDACKAKHLRKRSGLYHYTESGLPNVYLKNVEWSECPACGARRVTIPRMGQLHRCIAWKIVTQPAFLTPAEIVFLRKSLRMRQREFAEILGVDQVVLSRWETGTRQHSKANDQVIRFTYLTLQDDEYTHPIHSEIWNILNRRIAAVQKTAKVSTVTLDPSECNIEEEIRELVAQGAALSAANRPQTHDVR